MKMKRRIAVEPTIEERPRSLKIHCPVYNHIKNTIVCSLCCPVRDRCKEFQQFYEENRAAQDAFVSDYIESHRKLPPGSLLIIQYSLEVIKKKMNDTYIWIGQDDRAQVLTYEEVLAAADEGKKPKHIFLAKSELILRYQLVPKTRTERPEREPRVPKAVENGSEEGEGKRGRKAGKAVA